MVAVSLSSRAFGITGRLVECEAMVPRPLAGVLIYILLLLPSLGFLNIYFFIYSFVADHWQYLACLGIITPCASGIVLLARRLKSWQVWLEPGTTLLLGGVLFLLAWQQSRMYIGAETLHRTTITRNPACWLAYDHLIEIVYKTNRIPEAMELFKQALRIKPAVAHYSLGRALLETGRTSEAIDQYKQALQIDPDYAEAHNNLGSALNASRPNFRGNRRISRRLRSILMMTTPTITWATLWSKQAELQSNRPLQAGVAHESWFCDHP